MFTGKIPYLTKGPFALFYGGTDILPKLSSESGGSHLTIASSVTVTFLFLMMIFKKLKTRNLPTQQRLTELVVTNFLNVFSMFFILCILIITTWRSFNHTNIIKKNSSLTKDKIEKSPEDYWFDMLIIALFETLVQSVSFVTNPALR